MLVKVLEAWVLLYIVEPFPVAVPQHDARHDDRKICVHERIRHEHMIPIRIRLRFLQPLLERGKDSAVCEFIDPQRRGMGDFPARIIAGIILQPTLQSHVRPRHIGVGVDDALLEQIAFDLLNRPRIREQPRARARQHKQLSAAADQQLLRDHQKRRNVLCIFIFRTAAVLALDLISHAEHPLPDDTFSMLTPV